MASQDTSGGERSGWEPAHLEPLPAPTYWPAVMACGVMGVFWGFATRWPVSVVGLGVLGISVAGWIGDLKAPVAGRDR
jgi:hypothetical protein